LEIVSFLNQLLLPFSIGCFPYSSPGQYSTFQKSIPDAHFKLLRFDSSTSFWPIGTQNEGFERKALEAHKNITLGLMTLNFALAGSIVFEIPSSPLATPLFRDLERPVKP
jgi:hypothetical protein